LPTPKIIPSAVRTSSQLDFAWSVDAGEVLGMPEDLILQYLTVE